MAPPPPSHPAPAGPASHDAATPHDLPAAGRGPKNNNHKRKTRAKKQDQDVSGVDSDTTTANVPTDLDTDADADADVDAVDADADAELDVDADEMPKRPLPPPKRDVDISPVLNWQQRLQFDALNQGILANIEAQALKPFKFLDHPVAKQHRVKVWDFGPAFAAAQAAQPPGPENNNPTTTTGGGDEAAAASTLATGDGTTKEDGAEHSSPAPCTTIQVDANSVQAVVPSMNLLKEEATQYFNKWRATFLKRCNDLVVPKQSISDAGTSRQGQGALRGGGTGAGRGGKLPQEGMSSSLQHQASSLGCGCITQLTLGSE